jgi:hypothetical protein
VFSVLSRTFVVTCVSCEPPSAAPCAEDVGESWRRTELCAGEFNFVSHKSPVAQSGNQNQSLDDVANPL